MPLDITADSAPVILAVNMRVNEWLALNNSEQGNPERHPERADEIKRRVNRSALLKRKRMKCRVGEHGEGSANAWSDKDHINSDGQMGSFWSDCRQKRDSHNKEAERRNHHCTVGKLGENRAAPRGSYYRTEHHRQQDKAGVLSGSAEYPLNKDRDVHRGGDERRSA